MDTTFLPQAPAMPDQLGVRVVSGEDIPITSSQTMFVLSSRMRGTAALHLAFPASPSLTSPALGAFLAAIVLCDSVVVGRGQCDCGPL